MSLERRSSMKLEYYMGEEGVFLLMTSRVTEETL